MRLRRTTLTATPLIVLALSAFGCAPTDGGPSASDPGTTSSRSPDGAVPSGSGASGDPSEPVDTCTTVPDQPGLTLTDGTLTIGTDSPAYEPWFVDNDPTNGKGYESAVAYAVADRLGFAPDQVKWVTVPFNTSYQPGAKTFDFDINQISITPARAKVVDFSDGYYAAAQAVVAIKGTAGAGATSLAALKDLRLGAQTGTTSLTAIRDVIKPGTDPAVFENTNDAKQALVNDQVDAILADLPTAFYISAAEIAKSTIVGQFQPETGQQEEFGMLFAKGNPLVSCVDNALGTLTRTGKLDELQQKWLSDVVNVPVLQ